MGYRPVSIFALLAGSFASAELPAGTGLEETPGRSTLVARNAITPSVAVDANGALLVAVFDRASRNIHVLSSEDGGKTFGAPVVALDTTGRGEAGMQRGPRIAVDGKGTVFVSACLKNPQKPPYGADVIAAASRDAGKTFSAPVRVNDAPGSTPEMYQALAGSAQGGAWLSWLDLRREPEHGQMVYAARLDLDPDGKPMPAKNVEVYVSPGKSVCECCNVGIIADARGDVAVAFRNSLPDGTRDAFVALSRDRGATFSPAIKVGKTSWKAAGCPMDAPAVAASADGAVLAVAWMDRRAGESDPDVHWSTLPGGFGAEPAAAWSVETTVHNATAGKQAHPSLAADTTGAVIAVWEDGRSGEAVIAGASSRAPGRNFLLSERGAGKASFPALAVGKGLAVVTYEAGAGVWIRVFDPTALGAPPKR
jgi:hypothetical protein